MTGAQATGPTEGEKSRSWSKCHPVTTSLAQAGQLQAVVLLPDAGGDGYEQDEVQEDEQEQDDHSWHWPVAGGFGQHPHFHSTGGGDWCWPPSKSERSLPSIVSLSHKHLCTLAPPHLSICFPSQCCCCCCCCCCHCCCLNVLPTWTSQQQQQQQHPTRWADSFTIHMKTRGNDACSF